MILNYTKNRKVLLAENNQETASVLTDMLNSFGYECVRKENPSDLITFLQSSPPEQHPEIIILDIKTPENNALEHCRKIRTDFPDIILIIISDSDDNDTINKIYDAGAVDYLLYPVNHLELKSRVSNLIQIKHSQEMIETLSGELNEKNSKLLEISMTDELTKTYNRRFILNKLNRKIEELKNSESGKSLSLIIFDIDEFRGINECFGHLAGDKILHIVAQLAKNELNSDDLIGRFGGEEFIIVLNDSKPREAYLTAEKIRLRIRNASFSCVSGNKQVTISCGVASYQDNMSCNDLLKACDEKMYEAKRSGKDNAKMQ